MISYVLTAEMPVASTRALKFGEYAPATVAYKYADEWIPATTLYGHYCHHAPGFCRDEDRLFFYPALPAADVGGGLYGRADCEKEACVYVDFCTSTAFRGPKTGGRSRLRMAGIYIDRRAKTAKHGLIYVYELHPRGANFVTAANRRLEPGRLGYKKTYGWGLVKPSPLCHVSERRARRFLLLSPMPVSLLDGQRGGSERLRQRGGRRRLGRWFYYLSLTNRFYLVGRSFDEVYLMPMSEVELEEELRPTQLWERLREGLDDLKVYTATGREVGGETAELVKRKAAATMAAPVAALW
ncbi:MAG: hypothetical protein JHC20_05900 [Pyrobaculum sp.]|nr:hypothetical protein [Pyrobaculum sp.]